MHHGAISATTAFEQFEVADGLKQVLQRAPGDQHNGDGMCANAFDRITY